MPIDHPSIIAIDGYSSCGKSTFARMIAKKLNYVYIDSGAMYRAIALYCLNHKLINDKGIQLEQLQRALNGIDIRFRLNALTGNQETWLNGRNVEEEIRGIEVSGVVSKISQVKEVREKMVGIQREIGRQGGVVMDGRDIGSVVFPQAQLKIFMTADALIRAERRHKELVDKGLQLSLDEVKENIQMRDFEDENRKESPLQKAEDALVLDNSDMTIEQQMEWFIQHWKKLIGKHAH